MHKQINSLYNKYNKDIRCHMFDKSGSDVISQSRHMFEKSGSDVISQYRLEDTVNNKAMPDSLKKGISTLQELPFNKDDNKDITNERNFPQSFSDIEIDCKENDKQSTLFSFTSHNMPQNFERRKCA